MFDDGGKFQLSSDRAPSCVHGCDAVSLSHHVGPPQTEFGKSHMRRPERAHSDYRDQASGAYPNGPQLRSDVVQGTWAVEAVADVPSSLDMLESVGRSPSPRCGLGGATNFPGSRSFSATLMKSIQTGRAAKAPVSLLPSDLFWSKPIHTPQVIEGEKPTNQASVKLFVVPVFPAKG